MFDKYPYTDFHEMNLDWIIKEMKDLIDSWDSFSGNVTATAHEATVPEVTVSGDLKTSLDFDFGIVKGPRGATGSQGPRGEQGPAGNGLEILDIYPTLAALQSAHPTGTPGDAYLIGSSGNYTLYIWSESSSQWTGGGSLTSPSPSSTAPLMNGTASAGSSLLYSRADHVHPSDSSKLDKSSANGVYAVESGAQVMLEASDNSAADALVKYDSVGDVNTANLNASGTVNADQISVTNNTILNSAKLEGVGGSVNAYQILSSLGSDMDVLAMGSDNVNNTPTVKFNGGRWGNDGTMGSAVAEVKFTNSFIPDYVSYADGGRIGLAPATVSRLGGVKIGSDMVVSSDGTISRPWLDLLWTNASPSADFAGQTISLDLSNYAGYAIETDGGLYIFETGSDGLLFFSTSTMSYRNLTSTINGITFNDATQCTDYNSAIVTNNARCIPKRIFGIR